MKKSTKIIVGVIAVLILAYGIGVFYYSSHFLNNTMINGEDYSNQSAAKVEEDIRSRVKGYELKITERKGLKDSVKGSDIDLTFLENGAITKLQEQQNAFVWPMHLFGSGDEATIEIVSYDEAKLDQLFDKFNCFKKKNVTAPASARPVYAGKNTYKIQAEVEGNKVRKEQFKEEVIDCINNAKESLDIEEAGCYMVPKYRKGDEEITKLKEDMEKLVKGSVTYDYSNRYIAEIEGLKDNKYVVDGDITHKFIKIKDHTKAYISKDAVEDWLIEYALDTNTLYGNRKFKSHRGTIINVYNGPYGWRMDVEKETKAIMKMMKNGTKKTREPYYKQKGMPNTNGQLNDIGGDYVEVDMSYQMVYVYKNGKQVYTSSCVTGNTSLGRGTHTGTGCIQFKQRDKVLGGPGYDYASPVSYWMPFYMGEGLHDATWRSSFGGSIYKTNGSHGCVNLPLYAAAAIYDIVEAGWPVVCYY